MAGLPSDVLLARADGLARQWAIALIARSPLDGFGGIPLDLLAREAPSLCAQAIRALESDVELARLTGRGAAGGREGSAPARRLSTLAGAADAVAAVTVVEALRGVLWEALGDELREPSARLLGDAGDRLAHVCAELLAAALEAMPALGATRANDADTLDEVRERVVSERSGSLPGASSAVIVDELVQAPADSAQAARDGAQAVPDDATPEHRHTWQESAPIAPDARSVEIEIRDARREEGPGAWIGSIGTQLQRFAQDGLPFAVLLVELIEIERARREEGPGGLSRTARQMEQALADALGARPHSLTRERPGRCWLLVRDTDVASAAWLAEHLVRVLATRTSHAVSPLAVAIGTAVCPDEGRDAPALAAHADVSLYAARSALRTASGRPAGHGGEAA